MNTAAVMVFLVLYVLGVNIGFRIWRRIAYLKEDGVGKTLLYGFEFGAIILGFALVKEAPWVLAALGVLGGITIIVDRLEGEL